MGEPHVPEQRDYEVRRGKPPVHRRFKKGQSGNPRLKNWPALLVEALDEPVVLTIERAPRDHQARGGRHSAGNKSTSHSRPPMAQVHGELSGARRAHQREKNRLRSFVIPAQAGINSRDGHRPFAGVRGKWYWRQTAERRGAGPSS